MDLLLILCIINLFIEIFFLMEKPNNVQKAQEIAKAHEVHYDRFHGETSNDECFLSALEMAEWKDKHPSSETIKRILKVALTRTNIALADNLDDVDYDELIELANKTNMYNI